MTDEKEEEKGNKGESQPTVAAEKVHSRIPQMKPRWNQAAG